MSFINVSISSVRSFRTIGVSAGNDTYTFCPTTVLLAGEAFGNTAGSTFKWEQVLPYRYTIVDRPGRVISVTGDLVSSGYSNREIISFVVNEAVVFVTQIESMSYDGTDTAIVVTDALPLLITQTGKLLHAGNATDGSFSWETSQNQLNAVITPTVTSDKQFRLWSNRGQAHQRYDDADVVLTPRDYLLTVSNRSSTTFTQPPDCRFPQVQVISDSPYTPFVCGSGATIVDNLWAVRWFPPSCDAALVAGYVVQQSCDGGDSWATLSITPIPLDVSTTPGCRVRIGTIFNSRGTSRPLVRQPIDEIFDVVWTPDVFIPTSTNGSSKVVAGFDSICFPAGSGNDYAAINPITTFAVQRLLLTTYTPSDDLVTAPSSGGLNTEPITSLTITRLVLSVMDDSENVENIQFTPPTNTQSPITNFSVVGSGTIGG